MKEIFKQYSTYNAWANQRLGKLILSLSQEQIEQNIESSFPSVLKTLLHMWDAESIWWQRREINEQIIRPSTASEYTVSEIIKGLFEQNNLWAEWVSQSTEAALAKAFTYENSKREQFRQPMFQMLTHLFNHEIYHRGQLVTMLRQLAVKEIPATDCMEQGGKSRERVDQKF